jgi:hypothetical protein
MRRNSVVAVFLAGVVALVLASAPAWAVENSMSSLPTASTDGKTYAAKFAVGLTLDGGKSFITAANTGVQAQIQGTITPDPAHIGKKGDLFVVLNIGGSFNMRNVDGAFVPWNGQIASLVPAREGVTLAATQSVDVYQGAMVLAGDYRVFIGYLPASGSGLIYTPTPLLLNISQKADATTIFEASIHDSIIQPRCVVCHVKGGVADGRSTLLFSRDSTQDRQNFDIFKSFYNQKTNAFDYVLSKISGGDRHVGGIQLPKGSADYQLMESFLTTLEGLAPTGNVPSASAAFLNGVTLQSNLKTLRRAAIMLAGRLPTAGETSAVAAGNEDALRGVLLGLMTGQNFHDFLKDAANDRLLVRGLEQTVVNECRNCFPAFSNRLYELEMQAHLSGKSALPGTYYSRVSYSERESPLELIASVVENDRPYSEILTADYLMMNKVYNEAVGGTAAVTSDALTEFKPGNITGYYRRDDTVKTRPETLFNFDVLVNAGQLRTNYPHVGLLNDPAFLARYPSTATNRNRARARWTFFHFLGVDIEQSAQRTTDPTALADTNNPTMNNPNCNVCHATMDPVAGAFQDHGDRGFYKDGWRGLDALDDFYKFPATGTSLYRPGDTWYRDMRAPGFNQQLAGNGNSLRWLAGQIIADDRFPAAAVRFWWTAVIGRELLTRPEVATDVDYQARLAAFEAQEATIAELATRFTDSGLKVKSLLVDLLMSEWFRAESIDPARVTSTQQMAHRIAGLGNEKLLTPEQLTRKTKALTGFTWHGTYDTVFGFYEGGLQKDFRMYYGGIDSNGVTRRSRDITPLMSSVVLSQALESSCPIVYGEFVLDDKSRKLFGGISDTVTPLLDAAAVNTVESLDEKDYRKYSFTAELDAGPKKLLVSYLNEYCDWDAVNQRCRSDRNVIIDSVTLVRPGGSQVVVPGLQLELSGTDCGGQYGSSGKMLWNACTATYRFSATQKGVYSVSATVSASRAGNELARINLGFEADTLPAQSTSRGALALKQKLVELHQKLLGLTVTVDSPEVTETFALLADTWQSKRFEPNNGHLMREKLACNWGSDQAFLSNIGYPNNPLALQQNSVGWSWYSYVDWKVVEPWLAPRGEDPTRMKQSWQVVISYFLSHYNFIYE